MASVVYGGLTVAVAVILGAKVSAADAGGVQEHPADSIVFVAAWAASALVGATLQVRRPAHPVGWLFTILSVTVATWGLSESYGRYGLFVLSTPPPGTVAAAIIVNSIFIVVFVIIALVCSLTPDGRYLSRQWQMGSRVMVLAASVWVALRLVSPEPMEEPFSSVRNPWALTSVEFSAIRLVAAILTMALAFTSVVSLVVRFRRARGDVRRQLRWIVVAAVPIPGLLTLAFIAARADNDVLLDVATAGVVVLVPVGAGLAVARYHLYDVERVLSRAVTYLVVTGVVVGTYLAVVVVVAFAAGEAADRSPAATTAATLAAVVAARPVYDAVRNALDRRFQRRRYEAVRQVRTFVSDPPDDRQVERVLQQALNDPNLRVAYWYEAGSRWVTEAGQEAQAGEDAVPVERAGRTVAAVTTGCDDPAIVRAVLDVAAPELENARLRAAVAVQLEAVRASRERIAEAQINERRRIERDLHDGAQQRLLGAAAQMQAALLNGSAERLRPALELGVRESKKAVAELRDLANGLHPAALEDGGLASALEDLSSRLPVSVVIAGPKHRHPPIVEATMWFVACEAISNASKHADARRVTVTLDDANEHVRLIVEDDGRGGADPAGAGLRGLADRVEAAGGRFVITSQVGRGTRVEAVVPCTS